MLYQRVIKSNLLNDTEYIFQAQVLVVRAAMEESQATPAATMRLALSGSTPSSLISMAKTLLTTSV